MWYRRTRRWFEESTPTVADSGPRQTKRSDAAVAATAIDSALLPAFEHAFTARRVMLFAYIDRNERTTRRRAEPHGLLLRAPLWYVIAWDVEKDAPRLFRMDRMRHSVVTDQTFGPRPIDLVTGICPDAHDHRTSRRSCRA